MTEDEDKESSKRDKERADSEGMHTAIGAASAKGAEEQDLLAVSEFLQGVIKHFREEGDILTVEEAAQALFDELEGLDEYQEAFDDGGPERLRANLKEFLGPEEWSAVKEMESERAVRIDKTRGGTPG